MLDEAALRRPDFLPGTPLLLADGQWWTLPRPIVRGEDSAQRAFGDDYAALLEAIREAEDEVDLLRSELALAIALLDRNYRLTPENYSVLLEWGPSRTPLAAMQRAFRDVARSHLQAAPDCAPLPIASRTPPGRPALGILAAAPSFARSGVPTSDALRSPRRED